MLTSMMSILTLPTSLGLAAGPWSYSWDLSWQMTFCLAIMVMGIPLVLWLSQSVGKLPPVAAIRERSRHPWAVLNRLRRDQTGTATIEFTCSF